MGSKELTVCVTQSQKVVTFDFNDAELTVKYKDLAEAVKVPHYQVIAAVFDEETRILEIAYLYKKRNKGPFGLVRIEGILENTDSDIGTQWTRTLMHILYEGAGLQRWRRVKVLVNPHGGIGKGAAIYTKNVEPILRAARCSLDVTYTTQNGHATKIAKELPLDYDAIITVSGDGIIHEIMNGFANHQHPAKAFTIPIAPIPAGSGNGLSLNLLGIENGFDPAAAVLNVIKGKPMKVDVFSLTQQGKRTISFMSQALGLMAELDIGTEHLRWMGDARFMVGLIRGVIQFKSCPIQLSFKVAESDKFKMAEILQTRRLNDKNEVPSPVLSCDAFEGEALPPLRYSNEDTDGWTTFNEPVLYVYAGKGPYVGRDLMAFPVSLPDDGLIDIMIVPMSSRREILSAMGGAAKGEIYWRPKVHYVKAHAYRVKPLSPKGVFSVDGEVFPFEEFQVEVHRGLATLLSPFGHYAADFAPRTNTDVLQTTEGQAGAQRASQQMNEH
ncbi:ATP-NAD kinase-like domain-containing protein [Infundibulicybe gibba]|nr:ATP-NAD kinase-like domain-containing protein [Infundibulicybe gibba]